MARKENEAMKRLMGVAGALLLLAAGCGSEDAGAVNAKVKSVVVVGTSVNAQTLYNSGEYGLTLIPMDQAGSAVLGDGLKVDVTISTPGFTSTVKQSKCTAVVQTGAALSIGIIIDDSGSMAASDPQLKRRDATVAFLNTLGPNDEVLLTDYGVSGNDLRDLVCSSRGGGSGCSPANAGGFNGDKNGLTAATSQIQASGGTPLYESCVQMVPIVASRTGRRQAILLLSDGEPNSPTLRDKCHGDAKAAGIPVFTVGLGPASEQMTGSSAGAVQVLRELATATGASYASADDPNQLMALFANIGTALTHGKCDSTAVINEYMRLTPGTRIGGRVRVGNNDAMGTFEFVAPMKTAP
jgi:hypothetical protein